MDLGVLFLPNSIKKYLTTPPTKNEISHVQHHQRTTPYTLNLPASFMIHKVWISFQVYKWPRTAVDKNYGSLRKNVRFHNYSFLPFLANPWKWADKDYVARFQQFNVAQLANYFTVGVLYKVVTYSSWRISFVHAIAHKPAAGCMIISILRYMAELISLLSPLLIGSKLTFSVSSDRWLSYAGLFRVTSTTIYTKYIAQTMCKTQSRWF